MDAEREAELVKLTEHEMYVKSKLWLPEIADSLGVAPIFSTDAISFEACELIDRALIRMALMLITFEDVLGKEYGDLHTLIGKIYPLVHDRIEIMRGATEMNWQKEAQG